MHAAYIRAGREVRRMPLVNHLCNEYFTPLEQFCMEMPLRDYKVETIAK